jgi:repressor of nif and glnA expression
MKRNFDLVRVILIEFENRDAAGNTPIAPIGFSNDDVRYHIQILVDAGLINQVVIPSNGQTRSNQLTWEGHEFLDSIRDESQWEKIKSVVKDKGAALSFEVIKMTAGVIIKNLFNS